MSHFNVNVAQVRNWVGFLRNYKIISPGFTGLILFFKRLADFPWAAICKSNKIPNTLNGKAAITPNINHYIKMKATML